jgi:hypothetical protein
MGKRMSDEEKLLVGGALIGLGALLLYYLTAGNDRENNAALIPDTLEDRIDHVVGTLNTQVGKNWGNFGAEVLKAVLRKALPGPLVALVDAVYTVELKSRRVRMTSYTKRQRAVEIATR